MDRGAIISSCDIKWGLKAARRRRRLLVYDYDDSEERKSKLLTAEANNDDFFSYCFIIASKIPKIIRNKGLFGGSVKLKIERKTM